MKSAPLLLIVTLTVVWLLLSAELSAASFIFGAALSAVLALSIRRLRPVQPRVRNLHLIFPLVAAVLADILRSNLSVARIVLGVVRTRPVRSGFLDIPLELHDPHGLTVLAIIVTSTPGTSWAGVSPDGRTLRLHVLDLVDEETWIENFKKQYERRLSRIFE